MEETKYLISDDQPPCRVDKYVATMLGDERSRTYVRDLITEGHITVNGASVKPSYVLKPGDSVSCLFAPKGSSDIEPEEIPVNVIYEDNWIMVIDKTAGLVVHPGAGNKNGTLVSAVLFRCREVASSGDGARPGIVHRLDKDTSGLIVVAKNDRAHRSLSKQFQKRNVKKRYIALVRGVVGPDNGIVDQPLARDLKDHRRIVVDHERGKPACTVFHVAKRFERFTVLKLEPESGRTHQIRVHLAHIGHPVLGDKVYGIGNEMPRHALHADKLGFTHPDTGKFVEFVAPVPEDMLRVIKRGDYSIPETI
ncbi:MAG: RluA family pseudouridine synthase [Candidatus Omnitrophica bacterium]|nr:RluA family pseudouridine synthase [Candidatus Omnitrophota bacterium]